MKSDKDINNSLSEIKKVLTEKKKIIIIKKNTNFFLLEDLVKKEIR